MINRAIFINCVAIFVLRVNTKPVLNTIEETTQSASHCILENSTSTQRPWTADLSEEHMRMKEEGDALLKQIDDMENESNEGSESERPWTFEEYQQQLKEIMEFEREDLTLTTEIFIEDLVEKINRPPVERIDPKLSIPPWATRVQQENDTSSIVSSNPDKSSEALGSFEDVKFRDLYREPLNESDTITSFSQLNDHIAASKNKARLKRMTYNDLNDNPINPNRPDPFYEPEFDDYQEIIDLLPPYSDEKQEVLE